jgi:DNA ligase D
MPPGYAGRGGACVTFARYGARVGSDAVEVEIGSHTVRISSPDRVYFSARGETKLDLVNYYISVGPGIVRALRERPCMLHRYPDGVDGDKIYQKRLPKGAPEWVETVEVRFPSGRTADELCVTELAEVVWAVQMSTVEFHPWHSRRADTEHPDELRIDLDPQPGAAFAECKRVAAAAREVLTELGAVGWPKTSGSKGVHVYVRIQPRFGFREVRRAALAFAREVERRLPELVTTAWWKEERGEGKVFLDYNQNARDRTIASGYSVRGFPWGPVSAPVTWDELADVETRDFTIATMPARFAQLGDVHEGIDDAVWDIEPLLEWADRDERDRQLGDAPYPPNYPKQPGEPPRVQPSKKVASHWDDRGNRIDW